MLHIENGGDEQLVDELEAYAPMVPSGKALSKCWILRRQMNACWENLELLFGRWSFNFGIGAIETIEVLARVHFLQFIYSPLLH